MEPFFYASPEAFRADDVVCLPEEESAHAVRVLRLRRGDLIRVVDGKGLCAQVRITSTDLRRVCGVVIHRNRSEHDSASKLTVGLALLKRRSRFETFLEKAVELGVHAIIPLLTEYGESSSWRKARAVQIMIAAMKQSQRSYLPDLHSPTALADALEPGTLIAHAHADVHLMDALHPLPKTIRILVGPEGGFSKMELSRAQAHGATPVSLGSGRLRAETAAIAVCATQILVRGSWKREN